jgi:bacillopeptidase F
VKIFSDAGEASLSVIHEGFQWLLDPDGDPNTDDAPHVVNNSWGFDESAGACVNALRDDIKTLNASQILVVFAAGNGGPGPATSLSPANYPEALAVGAVNANLEVPLFSSRGPSACDESVYPDLVAPGVGVRTSDTNFGGVIPNSYVAVSGTSFAVAHVTGVVALLMSAFPHATAADIKSALNSSAADLGLPGPDDDSGYGLVDSDTAYDLLDGMAPQCTDADGDDYFAELPCRGEQDCNDNDATIHPGAIETKHDGVDQDCNSYDLTLEIESALYIENWDILRVVAESALAGTAHVELVGYGPMKWRPIRSKWVTTILRAGGNPETVVVSSPEGSESAATQVISVGALFGHPSGSP